MLTSHLKLSLNTRHRKLLLLGVLISVLCLLVLGMSITTTSLSYKPTGRDLDQWKRTNIKHTKTFTDTHRRLRKAQHKIQDNKNYHHQDAWKASRHKSLSKRRKEGKPYLRKTSLATLSTSEISYISMEVQTTLASDSPSQQLTENKPSLPEPESGDMMAAHENFDAERVYNLFCSCRKENDILLLDCYVTAYEELCKLFRLFGTVFSFVTSDVEEKIGILRDYRKSEHAEQYKTIQSMLAYEVASDTVKKKKANSGSRTLLRLHRALEFIMEFLLKLKESDNRCKFSNVVTKAYDDTLAKHHPWLIKKAVHMAMYMLPSRPDLMKKMGLKDDEKDMNVVMDLVKELNLIFKITQELYAADKLLDLP